MKYQGGIAPAQALERVGASVGSAGVDFGACDANINPRTGLATDYLNHFNEATMLLEMLSSCPDCLDDFLAWRPMSYREHFAASRFKGRDVAIAAYEAAEPGLRRRLDALAGAMTAMLNATRAALTADLPAEAAGNVAGSAAAWLKPLIARAAALINGEVAEASHAARQAVVDGLMNR